MSWATAEFADLDLGDARLSKRLVKLVEAFARQPMASIPAACGGWAETQAAYRFLSDESIDWQDMLSPHWKCTQERMRPHAVVLCIQDTTELDFNGQQIAGLGRLSYEAQRGMYLHPTYAVSVDREPLGVIDVCLWAREKKGSEADLTAPLESQRWVEGYERVAEQAASLPDTRLVYVADREGDLMALIRRAAALGTPADWLIRSKHNRKLPREKLEGSAPKSAKSAASEDPNARLWSRTTRGKPLGTLIFSTHRRPGRPSRRVEQQVWAERVTLAPGIEVSCIVARELTPPAGMKALEWRLLSNRPVADFAAASELIDWYRSRWEIEMLFDLVKNACKVESLQLSQMDRLERALALYLVVAWRIARLMRLGRQCPTLPVELGFEPEEWKGAYVLLKKPIPKKPPTLNSVIRLVATLGGFLGRKRDGEPGIKTLWIGMARIADFAAGVRHARAMGLA